MRRPSRCLLIVALIGPCALAGCGKSGPQIAPVHGRVTLDGRPLAKADVTFQPEGAHRPSTGRTNDDGRYELAYKRGQMGAMVGPNTARIFISTELVKNPPPIPDRYAIKYLIQLRDIEMSLAPIAGTRVMVPYRVSVPTPLGLGIMQATQFVSLPYSGKATAKTQ